MFTARVNANSMNHRTLEQCQSKAANFCSETRKRVSVLKYYLNEQLSKYCQNWNYDESLPHRKNPS